MEVRRAQARWLKSIGAELIRRPGQLDGVRRVERAGHRIRVVDVDPISRLWHAVPCFPSVSEVWLRLLEAYRG